MVRFKPTTLSAEQYYSVVHWTWRISFWTVFVNSVSNKEMYNVLTSCLTCIWVKLRYSCPRGQFTTPWAHMGEWRCSSIVLALALGGGEWSVSHPGCFPPKGEGPSVAIGYEDEWALELICMQWSRKKISRHRQELNPGSPACSQSLYWLRCPSSYIKKR
jgi:hypothetical protein